jgi:hypothetical protein
VFRVVGEEQLWRKVGPREARRLDARANTLRTRGYVYRAPTEVGVSEFDGKGIEVVERAAEIHRAENTLVLRGGEVTLEYMGAWRIHRCTPGDPLTEIVLAAGTFSDSLEKTPTDETALAFMVGVGAKELDRPRGSELLAYGGRVYARATKAEVLAHNPPATPVRRVSAGGYKRVRVIDGAKRVVIAGLLTVPGEPALYDIMMEHFGSDTVPR